MRLPTSWERVVPSARPTPVTSCPPYSCRGRPLSGAALSRRVPLRRRRYGPPSSARGVSGPTPLRPIAGYHEGNRRTEIRRADRTVCGWPQTSGEAGARCHLWVYRAVYGRSPLSMRSGNSTVSTRPPSAPVLRMRLIPAPERGGSMQGRGTASVPVRGSDGPDQPAVVSATATRRHVPPRSRSERTCRGAVGGRRASGAADNWLSRAPHFSRLLPST